MSRTPFYNKQNTSSSFYGKSSPEFHPFSYKQKQLSHNLNVIDNMVIESQTILQKLKQKISLDQNKIEQNYNALQELSEQMQSSCLQIQNNKQIQNIIRLKKQSYRNCLSSHENKAKSILLKVNEERKCLEEIFDQKIKEIQQEKQDRQSSCSKLIDQFQHELFAIEKQFKEMRKEQEESSDKIELLFYNLQQKAKDRLQDQRYSRLNSHETITKLIGQCIQNFRYAY